MATALRTIVVLLFSWICYFKALFAALTSILAKIGMQELAKGAKVINGKRFSSGASGDELGTWAKEYV